MREYRAIKTKMWPVFNREELLKFLVFESIIDIINEINYHFEIGSAIFIIHLIKYVLRPSEAI